MRKNISPTMIGLAVVAALLIGRAVDTTRDSSPEFDVAELQQQWYLHSMRNEQETPEEEYAAELCVQEGRVWNWGDDACVVPHGLD